MLYRLQLLAQGVDCVQSLLAFLGERRATVLPVIQLGLALREHQLQVGEPRLRSPLRGLGRRHLLPCLRRGLSCVLLDACDPHAFGIQHRALFAQALLGDALRQQDRLLPHRNKGLRHLGRQSGEAGFTAQALSQAVPPLIQQRPHPSWAAASQLQAHALHRRPFAARQDGIRRSEHLGFRYAYRHVLPPAILGLIIECYPTLFD
ncbi:hypothetical protein D9M69_564190 [compost metagenome]